MDENKDKEPIKDQEPNSNGPENTPKKESNEKKKKDNVYDQYKYWGSDKNDDGFFKGGPKGKLTLFIFIALVLSFGFLFFNESRATKPQEVTYSSFIKAVENGSVIKADIKDESQVTFTTLNGTTAICRIPYYDSSLMELLKNNNVEVVGSVQGVSFLYIFLQLFPWLIFGFIMFNLYRQTGAAGGKGMMGSLGKSNAHQYGSKDKKVTFADVAGQKESKYELQEVVEFLKSPERFVKIGARIPKGVLLVGPPGTGKTLLARAVAGEAGVNFFHTSGSDFVEMFVGMGAARVRDLFETGRKNAPCILFIDELDAVGRSRGSGLGGGHDEREQTLNQILVEMDGFSSDPGVIVIAATNRPDVLDPALLRPGRFDRQVVVDLPDVQERLDILRIHSKKVKSEGDIDLERIAKATPGSSGADLANLVNEAALFAARDKRETVSMADYEKARDKIILGVARESRFMTQDEKKATAYHEAGHTLLHYYLKYTDPLHKVTIIPHGRALGLTISLPEKDQYTLRKGYLLDRIVICMGGYVAEDIVYGETTTGTSNDIKQATDLAHRMVTEWGMSDLGFISLASEGEPLFLGREITQKKDFSDKTATRIDEEVQKILTSCMATCRDILTTHRDQLDKLTDELCEKETLDDSEIRVLLGFEPHKSESELV
ncbi:ATP-dependent zinc metalloprotease FtsH [Bullifex porci]|uniref:ATP-dependent zinc metalloprotease FtsH n=1 Tax=Bullifex porci TaxID=2606638 RepID=UPI0023F49941|nr:ATP-dependent zinc metalloprotease FtsH [Bullifex porci]MDD7255440.1 ATP-dependent zinc metalloprotease FtsH [Bullifex porci]MDY2741335.1 ATP-dependent zinc metalloprotease FtsH [Bullifex porci]